MSTLNKDQSDYWNGEVGQRWAAYHQALDAAFAPFTEALFAGAALDPGDRVLDIGCGAGDTALIAARRVGRRGRHRTPPRSSGCGPMLRIMPSSRSSITPSPASA